MFLFVGKKVEKMLVIGSGLYRQSNINGYLVRWVKFLDVL